MATRHATRAAVLVVMCIGYFLVLLDVTIVNVALPHIGSDLGADVAALQWVVDGYALALASLMLTAGTVGDLHGHKRVVLGGLALFGIASLGCGLAPRTAGLIGFRVVQGVGAAVMLPGTLAVIAHAYPDGREQAKAIGIWAGIGSVALPGGPLLGGALTQALSWRAIFFLNVPLVAAALVVARRVVSETREPQGRRLDVPGAVLGAGALAALVVACIRAGQSGLGTSVVVAGIASIGLGAAFIRVERAADDPLLPFGLFRRPAFPDRERRGRDHEPGHARPPVRDHAVPAGPAPSIAADGRDRAVPAVRAVELARTARRPDHGACRPTLAHERRVGHRRRRGGPARTSRRELELWRVAAFTTAVGGRTGAADAGRRRRRNPGCATGAGGTRLGGEQHCATGRRRHRDRRLPRARRQPHGRPVPARIARGGAHRRRAVAGRRRCEPRVDPSPAREVTLLRRRCSAAIDLPE